jgi:uncharacterized protein YrzB (UPF0473 family)
MQKQTLNEQAQEIVRLAEQHGVEQNFFFITTFKRYQVQINILNDLEKAIKDDGTMVTKEYVKNRKNLYTHPAVSGANQTVQTLMKIIATMREEDSGGENALLEYFRTRRK